MQFSNRKSSERLSAAGWSDESGPSLGGADLFTRLPCVGRLMESWLERSAQGVKRDREGSRRNGAEPPDETAFVENANLIAKDQTVLTPEPDRDPIGRRATARRHRSDQNGSQIVMHLWRRNDQARPRLLNFATDRGIKAGQPDIASSHHDQSASASVANSGQTRASSSVAANCFEASAQPALGWVCTGVITRLPASTRKSTVSPCRAPISLSRVLGMMTPDELPILRSGVNKAVLPIEIEHCYNISPASTPASPTTECYRAFSTGW
jgi:hypothetical protein